MRIGVNVPIVDDAILENIEEGFLGVIQLESAMFPGLIRFDNNRLALFRIRENDGEMFLYTPSYVAS